MVFLGHADPIPQGREFVKFPALSQWLALIRDPQGLCREGPVCAFLLTGRGMGPVTSGGHTGLGEDIVPISLTPGISPPCLWFLLESPLGLTAGSPSCCLISIPSQPAASLLDVELPSPSFPPPPLLLQLLLIPPSPLLPWLLLYQSLHWHELRATLRAGG